NYPRDTYWDITVNPPVPHTVSGLQATPFPLVGHGTHTSGIIAATANNDGVAGACWGCSLMMAKTNGLVRVTFGTSTVYKPFFNSTQTIANAIHWLVDRGA